VGIGFVSGMSEQSERIGGGGWERCCVGEEGKRDIGAIAKSKPHLKRANRLSLTRKKREEGERKGAGGEKG